MKNSSRTLGSRVAAALGAIVVAAVAMTASAGAASAAPANVPTAPGTLTIHKYEQPSEPGTAPDGTAITVPATWNPLTGVNFRIEPITDIDLSTTEGWTLAADYAADPSLATELGTAIDVVTGADGSITQALPVAAYLVTETASPAATLPDGSAANITMSAAPFVVTVPMPLAGGQWNSDVHVYPKNSLTAVDKTPGTPVGDGVGAILPWTVTVKIPTLAPGAGFTNLDMVDPLDAKLNYLAGSASATIDGTPIAFNDASTLTTVDLRITDLAALAAAGGQELVFTFRTTVVAPGEVLNTAAVYINDPSHSNGIESNTGTTYWGQIEIVKHATGDENATLAGAVFSMHASAADAANGSNPISVVVDGEPRTQFTSGADGTVVVPGLYISNTSGDTRTFFLKEVQAPAGYQVLSDPIEVVLTAGAANGTPIELNVPNSQVPTFELPLTGAAGAITLSIVGGLLLLGGVSLALTGRRRRDAQA